ncbi:MAG: hypothetical protein ACRD6W_06130 [Nitrososphaerales archaeon]
MNSARVRKTLDRLAYASLFLDVCIAVITGMTVIDVQATERLLLPVDYLLTAVVILSVVLFVVLLFMKSMERESIRGEKGKND